VLKSIEKVSGGKEKRESFPGKLLHNGNPKTGYRIQERRNWTRRGRALSALLYQVIRG